MIASIVDVVCADFFYSSLFTEWTTNVQYSTNILTLLHHQIMLTTFYFRSERPSYYTPYNRYILWICCFPFKTYTLWCALTMDYFGVRAQVIRERRSVTAFIQNMKCQLSILLDLFSDYSSQEYTWRCWDRERPAKVQHKNHVHTSNILTWNI